MTYEIIFESNNGKIIHGDNLCVMESISESTVDSIISDFPYNLSFMGRNWDNASNFYDWCKLRALGCLHILKPGGYVAIFGHPKSNHRMKCAFEDVGFRIVEEIDWLYLSGMPKSQDIGKMFDREAGAKRQVVGEKGLHSFSTTRADKNHGVLGKDNRTFDEANQLTAPATDLAKLWDGWKTAGLKPAHEPITIFQKPLDGKYTANIEKYGCGAMNIDACRVPISQADVDMMQAKASKNPTSNYSNKDNHVYGKYALDFASPAHLRGRFPSNIIIDEFVAGLIDEQTGVVEGIGGGSRLFTIVKYCPKVSPSERKLPNGERNPHVTLKPVELIKWIVKLLTPIDGVTVDITAGSCTHGVACEELNRDDGYSLKWIDIENENTETEPYCNIGKDRVEGVT